MRLAILCLAAVSLAGCGTLTDLRPEDKVSLLKGAGEHIEKCTRHYYGSMGGSVIGGAAPIGFDINCPSSLTLPRLPVTTGLPQGSTPAEAAAVFAQSPEGRALMDAAVQKALEEFTAPKQ